MPHGQSWLNFIPGFEALKHWIHDNAHGVVSGAPAHAQHVASAALVAILLLFLGLRARAQLKAAGDDVLPEATFSVRTFVELLFEGVLAIMQFAMSREAAMRHVWLVGPLGFFILFSNLLGLIPGFLPPTENLNTTLACGSLVFLYYNVYALKRLGFGHISHMLNPVGEPWGWFLAPLFGIIEPISHLIRPVSLAVRLMCNIAGDHLVLSIFIGIFPLFLPIPFVALGTFVALVQTFVFTLLASVYIGEVEANIEHHLAHAHAHGHGSEAPAHA